MNHVFRSAGKETLVRIIERNTRHLGIPKCDVGSLASRVITSDEPLTVLKEFATKHGLP